MADEMAKTKLRAARLPKALVSFRLCEVRERVSWAGPRALCEW